MNYNASALIASSELTIGNQLVEEYNKGKMPQSLHNWLDKKDLTDDECYEKIQKLFEELYDEPAENITQFQREDIEEANRILEEMLQNTLNAIVAELANSIQPH